ncbi:TetR/AcrR family transcriptional regulator [Sinomonas mesophila]|uniref:TetR/AcrR family transcriptional regulator n=1 Tax=Sinomonas mesophila TaxID=1531955 RepID=UPI00098414CF|nr:TetR/AcrR family transcriptional regulator [Sinomonas mesophila]
MNGREDGLSRGVTARSSARERILDTSYQLFARRGIRDVGVDELIARSGVAKATFYRHFPSKESLVMAYMERWFRERRAAIAKASEGRSTPEEALLAAFEVLDDWFRRDVAEVGTFLQVMIEMGPNHPLGRASIEYLGRVRAQLADLAKASGLRDPEGFAWSFHILTKGAIIASLEGDGQAATRARDMARALIELHRPQAGPVKDGRSDGTPRSKREQNGSRRRDTAHSS